MNFTPSSKDFNFFPVFVTFRGRQIQESRACQCWHVWENGKNVHMAPSLEAAKSWIQLQDKKRILGIPREEDKGFRMLLGQS